MEKSFKKSHRCSSHRVRKAPATFLCRAALAALLFSGAAALAAAPNSTKSNTGKKTQAAEAPSTPSSEKSSTQLENHQDLILKAQNLSLQQDRLQASQVLVRGLQRESRHSQAFKELSRALDELTGVFYTEKAQNAFAAAESLAESKPRDAIDSYNEALKIEDRNVTVLKALSRVHLRLDECDRAESRVKLAEDTNPFSGEIKLLRLQVLACQKNFDELASRLQSAEGDLEDLKKFTHAMRVQEHLKTKDVRKARTEIAEWETRMPDYPEIFFWRWEISKIAGSPDRTDAARYLQLCQNLSARKRKSFALDVNLCRGRELAEAFLKESENKATQAIGKEGASQ